MTEYSVNTRRQWIRPRAAASTAAWRGLSLGGGGATVDSPGEPIPFATVLAHSGGIRTTGPHTFGAYTLPTGAGGEVPADAVGLWRLCVNNEYVNAADSGLWALMIVVNNFSWFLEKSYIWTPPERFTWSIAPVVRELAEGDVVWAFANVQGTGVDIGGDDATLLMEFLGPVPAEPS